MSTDRLSTEYPIQESELVYALDIGTRSVIGMLGKAETGKVHILAIEKLPHAQRAMLDGQIEDIDQVAETVAEITQRLEKKIGRKLVRACVAAAGRSLRTENGTSRLELDAPTVVENEQIQQLTAGAVSNAEYLLRETETEASRMFLVGYTTTQFCLDGYPMTKLQGHKGKVLEATVVATFLPSEVVDSLNAVLQKAGLETASLTLEPIAALNAAIPPQLRLLNLVLVDIGAGTSDIAVCRDGSVVGYTMATVAGDEISEAIMRGYLVDYETAERMKTELSSSQTIRFQNVVGFEQSVPTEEILSMIESATQTLVEEIANRIVKLNNGPPSAVFLAGGGSKLVGLCEKVANALKMDHTRVALAGGHFKTNSYSEDFLLDNPEYATPLGIAVSSSLGLIHDSSCVFLNGVPAKLFRSGQLSVLDLLMMNGYRYDHLIGRSGRSLSLYVDGKRMVYHGTAALPARILINGTPANSTAVVYAGDKIEFSPAENGMDRAMNAAELMELLSAKAIWRHGVALAPGQDLQSGDRLTTVLREEERSTNAVQNSDKSDLTVHIWLNGTELSLPAKQDGLPYYLMDLLEYSGLDFEHLEHPVSLKVNGREGLFQQEIKPGDHVKIQYTETMDVSLL